MFSSNVCWLLSPLTSGTITNGHTYHGPVNHGTIYHAGRDLTVTVVKGGRP